MKPAEFYRSIVLSYEADACLLWPFAKTSRRYPALGRPLKSVHRLVCEAFNGPPPQGHNAAHSCGQSLCVNKRHIRWATQRENIADKVIHGTMVRGPRQHLAKLTEADVLAIRAKAGTAFMKDIGASYGVTKYTVHNIIHRKTWKHI